MVGLVVARLRCNSPPVSRNGLNGQGVALEALHEEVEDGKLGLGQETRGGLGADASPDDGERVFEVVAYGNIQVAFGVAGNVQRALVGERADSVDVLRPGRAGAHVAEGAGSV